jgi:hypothetical protein
MNTKKSQFLFAVRVIAANDPFIVNLAECVAEDALPDQPGAMALRFVTAISRLCEQKASPDILKSGHRTPAALKSRRVACRGEMIPATAIPIHHRCHAS